MVFRGVAWLAAVVDGHERHASFKRHCRGCLERTIHSKRGDRIQYYHRVVGRVSRDTLYEWLKDPAFKAELDRQRAEQVAQGLALLSQSVYKAVETLVGLLEDRDGRLKRLAARDILDQHVKFRELDELTQRIEAIEERLEARG